MDVTSPLSVDQLLAVANTRHGPAGHWHARVGTDGPDHDHLADPVDAVRFLRGHDVPVPSGAPPASVLGDLAVIARGVRELAADAEGIWPTPALRELLRRATYRLGADGALMAAAGEPWQALVDGLLPVALGLGERRADLRVCGNPLCRFIFLDRSRNRSRRWCDMSGCGNRAKVRRYRHRHAAGASERAAQGAGSRIGLSRIQPSRTTRSSTASRTIGRRSGR